MKRRTFIRNSSAAAIIGTAMISQGCTDGNSGLLGETQIQHGVIFSLKHEKGSADAAKFLEDGRKTLTEIPVVRNFQVFNQVSPKNEYDYSFTMIFDSMEDYQTYNNHPNHVAFVENRWMKEVEKFLEIDFETA
jgi:hypothetical protein